MDLELHPTNPTALGRWRHPAWRSAATALAALVLGWGLAVAAPLALTPWVTVTDSDGQLAYARLQDTVGATLATSDLAVGPHDQVIPPLDSAVPATPRHIYIQRAVPVTINGPKDSFTIWTVANDVSGLKNHPELKLGPHDRLWPGSGTPIKAGMTIKMARVEVQDAITTIDVQPPTSFIRDASLPRGHTVLVSAGKPGKREQILRTFIKNGLKSGTTLIPGKLLAEAVPEVRKVGMRVLGMSREMRGNRMMIMESTAYEPGPVSCGKYADGYTATGRKATYGVCAVDPRVIPLGTRLYIEGYGVAIAADTGGAIKGLKVDVCFDTLAECYRWGRRKTKVWILDKNFSGTIPVTSKDGTVNQILAVSKPAAPGSQPAAEPPKIIEPTKTEGDLFGAPAPEVKPKGPLNLLDPTQVLLVADEVKKEDDE